MKLPALIVVLAAISLLNSSPAFAQQQGGGLPTASPSGSTQQSLPFATFATQRGARIRVTGAPSVQPSPGLGVECTPVEQSIAGVIIGPTDLCDR
jgi:hypothetical protein